MKVCIIGTGYVGLPTGVGLCTLGHKVTCVDKDAAKIANLNYGHSTLYEPYLKELLEEHLKNKAIKFTTDIKKALKDAKVVILAVGTPTSNDGASADLTYIKQAAKEVAENLPNNYTVICTKSTVPVGTNDLIEDIFKKYCMHTNWDIVSLPEFLKEGCAIKDFLLADRIVIGTDSKRARQRISTLYSGHSSELYFTSRRSAELIKYASNAFLAIKINYINEIANLCEKCGAKVDEVAKGMGLDRRIGNKFLQAGIGFGGSCFPKDTKALSYTAQEYKTNMPLVDVAILENHCRVSKLVKRIESLVKPTQKLALLGLTFKANTDDCRESQAVKIADKLSKKYKHIKVYDPKGMDNAKKVLKDKVEYAKLSTDAVKGADAIIILTGWNSFKVNFKKILKNSKKSCIIIDYVNLLNPKQVTNHKYYCIGK